MPAVHIILERDAPAVAPAETSEFADGVGSVIANQPIRFGKNPVWLPADPETRRELNTKKNKGAKQAKELAGSMADELVGVLTTVTPDACSRKAYSVAWDLASDLRAYERGDKGAARSVANSLTDWSYSRSVAYECAVAEGQPGAMAQAQMQQAVFGLANAGSIDLSTGELTKKGERLLDGRKPPEGDDPAAAQEFVIALWEEWQAQA